MSAPASFVKPGDDDAALAFIRMIVYSHPGEGKTVFWGSGGEQVLIMVSDPEGTISASSLGHKFGTVQVTDYGELHECYEWLKHDKPAFKWIVWDSLTLFQDRALHDDIMADAVAQSPKQDMDVPSRREYLQSMNRIGRYVRMFSALPYNFGISAHIMEVPSPDGDGMMFGPAVQGKGMSSKVSGYANVVGFLHKRKVDDVVVQSMLLQQQGRLYAKNRFAGSTGQYMDKPSLPKINEAIAAWRRKVQAEKGSSPAPSARGTRRRRPTATASATQGDK